MPTIERSLDLVTSSFTMPTVQYYCTVLSLHSTSMGSTSPLPTGPSCVIRDSIGGMVCDRRIMPLCYKRKISTVTRITSMYHVYSTITLSVCPEQTS